MHKGTMTAPSTVIPGSPPHHLEKQKSPNANTARVKAIKRVLGAATF